MQIYAVAPQVRNLNVSKHLQRASDRTSGLLGLLSCGLVNRHPALAFLAECTVSQTQQGRLHGVCLFDRRLNRPSMDLANFPLRVWIPVAGSVEGRYYLSRTARDGQALRLARPPTLHRAFCKSDAGLRFASGNLAPAHFPPQLQSLLAARSAVATFLGYPS